MIINYNYYYRRHAKTNQYRFASLFPPQFIKLLYNSSYNKACGFQAIVKMKHLEHGPAGIIVLKINELHKNMV